MLDLDNVCSKCWISFGRLGPACDVHGLSGRITKSYVLDCGVFEKSKLYMMMVMVMVCLSLFGAFRLYSWSTNLGAQGMWHEPRGPPKEKPKGRDGFIGVIPFLIPCISRTSKKLGSPSALSHPVLEEGSPTKIEDLKKNGYPSWNLSIYSRT